MCQRWAIICMFKILGSKYFLIYVTCLLAFFIVCDKIHDRNNRGEEKFILVHGFREISVQHCKASRAGRVALLWW